MEKKVPKYGLKLKLDHSYPEKWTQHGRIKIKQILPLLMLIIRYICYYIKTIWTGRKVIMDYIYLETGKQIYGVPAGGIGSGSIGRGYRGEFCRYQLNPGVYEYNTVAANQFIVTIKDASEKTIFQSVLSTYEKPKKHLTSWQWLIDGSKCLYTGLYPRSWTEYDLSEYGVKLFCRQISPVIPNNYKDSCLPCAVFIWDVENLSSESRTVTIAFTFKNGTGDKKQDKAAPCWSKSFTFEKIEGVLLHHVIKTMPCTYALVAKASKGVNISKCLSFDPNSNGEIPWNQLNNNGKFDATPEMKASHVNDELACGIACQTKIQASNTKSLELCLVWDMPIVTFYNKIKKHKRFYTKFFGTESASAKIAEYALENYTTWETEIYNWQNSTLEDDSLPDWYKSAIFNELYYVSDGGTCWFTTDENEFPKDDPRYEYGRFAYLESHEYRMYNTYDVHFYASYALAINWPCIQVSLQYGINDAIFTEINRTRITLYEGEKCKIKTKDTVPHDIGDPYQDPFTLLNAYPIHDVSVWRDLNVKFVLQVYRDYVLLDKVQKVDRVKYLKDMYNACKTVMKHSATFDKDGDGLIENGGFPDQTFDSWIMTGPSAYCGGLWLAALKCMSIISDTLSLPDDKIYYDEILERGKQSFETKIWNGKYYKFDTSENGNTIMADQLCGHWYLRCCGLNYEVFPKEHIQSALQTIFANNVEKFANCERGAVNGFLPTGKLDPTTIQSEEIWTGVTYALTATMIFEDMEKEAWKTSGGMFQFLTERIGMIYETPEAFNKAGWYRAIGYMRPLSIWSIHLALQQQKSHTKV